MRELIETSIKAKPRAILVGISTAEKSECESKSLLEELEELAQNLDIDVIEKVCVRLREVNPHYYIGRGKFEQILESASQNEIDLIIIDEELTPAQQRNWEVVADIPVINRQEVILDIFAARASTREARLQVELAKLEYALPRLRKAWSHLDRQRGGGVTQRGGGESQLELDRRSIREQIAKLKRELEQVRTARDVQRKRRMRVPMPSAAIVGYTNAGKSSLINLLAEADLLAEDKLFATLDPSTRRMILPSGQVVLLTDTVGFVRNLPHRFVEAFKATLEEAVVADFLIHLVDSSSPDAEAHIETTMKVLQELGADRKKIITVFNKTDLPSQSYAFLHSLYPDAVWISVKKRQNIEKLIASIEKMVASSAKFMRLLVPHSDYSAIAELHKIGTITEKKILDEGVLISANIPIALTENFKKWLVK